jgi:hypothetical protein
LFEKSEKTAGKIDLLAYGRRESLFSDHRPVFAIFEASVCTVNAIKKNELEKKLLDQLFAGPPSVVGGL